MKIETALTFDDVSLVPHYSEVLPTETKAQTDLGRGVVLSCPLISAAMDTVTESQTAIAMAHGGGIGVVHKSMSIERQAREVSLVKRFESGVVREPVTLHKDDLVSQVFALMKEHGVSGFPVIDDEKKAVGVVTRRDLRLSNEATMKVSELMSVPLVTAREGTPADEALEILNKNRIEKLPLINDKGVLVGLMTVRDLVRGVRFPNAARDDKGRLLVAAAVGPSKDVEERAKALVDAGADMIVVDTAHGHSKGVIDTVALLREKFAELCLVGGNIATAEAASALLDAGADVVKVGIGPGSICTTRIVAGVGVPQVTAIMNVAKVVHARGKKLIADGGIRSSGDCVKALAAGAHAVMVGSMLAGTKEAPGEMVLYQGRSFKVYRGMGSLGAMKKGSKDRYGQAEVSDAKLVPEGVEGRVPFRGPVADTLTQLVGGISSGMGYLGASTLDDLHKNARFVRVTNAGLRESHVHDVSITKEAPNYQAR